MWPLKSLWVSFIHALFLQLGLLHFGLIISSIESYSLKDILKKFSDSNIWYQYYARPYGNTAIIRQFCLEQSHDA